MRNIKYNMMAFNYKNLLFILMMIFPQFHHQQKNQILIKKATLEEDS